MNIQASFFYFGVAVRLDAKYFLFYLEKPPRPIIFISNVTSHSISVIWKFPANAWVKTFVCFEVSC